MPYLEPVAFKGQLRRHGHAVDIDFTAGIDGDGVLELTINALPFSHDAFELYDFRRPGERVEHLTLDGTSDNGWSINSQHFVITKFNFGSQAGRAIQIQGHCALAELRRYFEQPTTKSRISWIVRQLRAVHTLSWEGPLGRVIAGGPLNLTSDSQYSSGAIQLTHPTGAARDEWWTESEYFMTHVARVLSFAYDTYLLPVIEQRVHQNQLTWRVVRRGPAAPPFLPPFHEVHMEPIFQRACESFATHKNEVEALDPAIRWLTAQVALWEQRLINAVTALESIIDRTAPDGTRQFMTGNAFKRLRKDLKAVLTEKSAPTGMFLKIPDLNRRSIKEQLTMLLDDRGIHVRDFPSTWIDDVIKARNFLVHTGVAPETETESSVTFEQIVWSREVVTRLILERIGFIGPYCSWLHHHEQLHFPECERMDVWAARQQQPPLTADP